MRLSSGETILITVYLGLVEEQAVHSEMVVIMISRETQKTLIGWEQVSPRKITSKFKTTHKRISLKIIQFYAPTYDDTKDKFNQPLEETIRKCSARDIIIVMGDMNAKVGTDNTGFEEIMGTKVIGTMNENGELFCKLLFYIQPGNWRNHLST